MMIVYDNSYSLWKFYDVGNGEFIENLSKHSVIYVYCTKDYLLDDLNATLVSDLHKVGGVPFIYFICAFSK